jgi:hypothetical protein
MKIILRVMNPFTKKVTEEKEIFIPTTRLPTLGPNTGLTYKGVSYVIRTTNYNDDKKEFQLAVFEV